MGRPNGHVARLPFALRQRVNFALRDGTTYSEIAAFCAEADHSEVTEKNVENWANGGGYETWTREQSRIEDLQARRDLALRVAEGGAVDITGAAMQIAASDIMAVLEDFDIGHLKTAIAEDPTLYGDLVTALAKLGKGSVEFAKYKTQVEERKRAIEAEVARARDNGAVTPETLERIERELKLL